MTNPVQKTNEQTFSGSTPILGETNCVCDHFQFACHIGGHILSLRVNPVRAIFCCVQDNGMAASTWDFYLYTDVNAYNCMGAA